MPPTRQNGPDCAIEARFRGSLYRDGAFRLKARQHFAKSAEPAQPTRNPGGGSSVSHLPVASHKAKPDLPMI
jgi:hypothetical protein